MTARRALVLPILAAVTAVVVLARGCSDEQAARLRSAPGPTTAPPVSSTTVVSEPERRSAGADLARRWPIVARLPHEAPAWRVDYRVEGGQLVLKVRLRALPLRDAGAESSYESQLRRYKAEALAWLGPGPWTIEWDPPEAATL